MRTVKKFLHNFSGQLIWSQVNQHQMIVCSTGYDLNVTRL